MPGVECKDIIKVAMLVVLEGILSADNAIVLAVLVLPLPKNRQGKALRYGIFGAFGFRIVAVALATQLIKKHWIILLGGLYLLQLPIKHFLVKKKELAPEPLIQRPPRTFLGLSQFWSTVAAIELTDIVFSIDSIMVAVGMSRKMWVIITGGILGIITMRSVARQLLLIIERFPALVDGAYVIVAWVGMKLVVEFLHKIRWIEFEIPEGLYLSIIGVIFVVSLLFDRKAPATIDRTIEESAAILAEGVASNSEEGIACESR